MPIQPVRILVTIFMLAPLHGAGPTLVEFTVNVETVMKHDDGKFLWFHPRAAAIPSSRFSSR